MFDDEICLPEVDVENPPEDRDYTLKWHQGNILSGNVEEQFDEPLPDDCLIRKLAKNGVKLLVCITMYNEPYE